jgi:hypothetical protein
MNIKKAKKYLEDRIEYLEESRAYAQVDANMSGPMCYEDRMLRDSAARRLVSIEKELTTINDILGEQQ